MPSSSAFFQWCIGHESTKYDSLSGIHTHPRATIAAMLLAGLYHRSASGLATPYSILSTIHPNVDDGSHSANTWYPHIVGHQTPQTDEEIFTPWNVEVHLQWDLLMRPSSHPWPSKTNDFLVMLQVEVSLWVVKCSLRKCHQERRKYLSSQEVYHSSS